MYKICFNAAIIVGLGLVHYSIWMIRVHINNYGSQQRYEALVAAPEFMKSLSTAIRSAEMDILAAYLGVILVTIALLFNRDLFRPTKILLFLFIVIALSIQIIMSVI